jgi:hypothetical protein
MGQRGPGDYNLSLVIFFHYSFKPSIRRAFRNTTLFMIEAKLAVFHNSELIQECVLGAETCRVGRHPSNDLVVDCAAISAHHALLAWENDRLMISDLHSQNGTQLNGAVVTKSEGLAHGDVVALSNAIELHFELSGGVGKVPVFPKTDSAAGPVRLPVIQVSLQGGPGPIAVLVNENSGARVELRSTNRAVMLYLLARQRKLDLEKGMHGEQAGWMNDDVLRGEVWGITRKTMGPNNLQVLLFRTRQQLEKAGLNGWIVEKKARHTRLVLTEIALFEVFPSA